MKFWNEVELIREIAGQSHLEDVIVTEILEDPESIAKMVCDPEISDRDLGKMVRNMMEITLFEEADFQQDKNALEVSRERLEGYI